VEPLELFLNQRGVVVQPPVVQVAIHAVQSHNAVTLAWGDGVISSPKDGVLRLSGQPLGPQTPNVLIKPIHFQLFGYLIVGETIKYLTNINIIIN